MSKHNFVTHPQEQKFMSISKTLMNQYLYRKCVKDIFYVNKYFGLSLDESTMSSSDTQLVQGVSIEDHHSLQNCSYLCTLQIKLNLGSSLPEWVFSTIQVCDYSGTVQKGALCNSFSTCPKVTRKFQVSSYVLF